MSSDLNFAVAFDVDNTLLDPGMRAYKASVAAFLSALDLGLPPHEKFAAYEAARSRGRALERLGLRDPIHERGNAEALAVFCMANCANSVLQRELTIDAKDQDDYHAILNELAAVDEASRDESFNLRLEAECRVRAFCDTDLRANRFRSEAQRVAQHPRIVEWAQTYRALELAQPVEDLRPFMESLSSRELTPFVITEGRMSIQVDRLDRLKLLEFFRGRVLVTETAANVPGVRELDEAISQRIDDRIAAVHRPVDQELAVLWYFRCLIDEWATKTPSFYARCLHALQHDINQPQDSFEVPIYVPGDSWLRTPLRFVMVGDRYDKDVKPLTDLLGPGVGMKIRLRMGKYGHLHSEDELPPGQRPDRTFTDWDALAAFLTGELSYKHVRPITTPPDIVNRADIRPDYVERGLESPYEAVRCVAQAVTQMMTQ